MISRTRRSIIDIILHIIMDVGIIIITIIMDIGIRIILFLLVVLDST